MGSLRVVLPRTEGTATQAVAFLSVSNDSRSCQLVETASLTVMRSGARITSIRGNPVSYRINETIAHGATMLFAAWWANWCASRSGIFRVRASLGMLATTGPYNVLPECLGASTPSRLRGVRELAPRQTTDGSSGVVSANTTGDLPASNAVRARLRSIIVSFARQNGDSHPRDLRVVETTSTTVESGSVGQPSVPVYDVAASGHFVAYDASIPPGAKAPTGVGLWIVVQRNASFSRLGWGVDKFDVNLRRFGKVKKL
jgi:hypothetical protein